MLDNKDLKVVYRDYDTMAIKNVIIPIDHDQYKVLTPKVKTVEINGELVDESYVELKVVDNQISYELIQELDSKQVRELIKVLQQLGKQLTNKETGRC